MTPSEDDQSILRNNDQSRVQSDALSKFTANAT
jgi:hypothetical protein